MKPARRFPLRALALTVCSLLALSACATDTAGQGTTSAYADAQGPTVIGTDRSAESRVVAALYGELLTAAGAEVKTATTVYASPADAARAVVEGEIGLAPAYESTMLRALPGGQTLPGNMAATLSMALPPGIVALPPAAAERGVVLAVTRATARRHGLRSLTDLAETDGRLTLGGAASGDPDAPTADSLKTAYGVTLAPADTSADADVLVLRGTDPVLTRDQLVVLTDPEAVVPPEHVFPLIAAPDAGLAARKALAKLNSRLTTAQLVALTASVESGRTPAETAKAWLKSEGLLD
ncbi:glycine betaine ABC transporter substrate-binding protein [Streptomyces sp. NPDC096132]|uniref:glycine betaine ABC transporter substrate-binding protein n=1 Tax=Streptomyces sp. NPDC096132 TaxID=3366075 RepID=UPI00381F99F6